MYVHGYAVSFSAAVGAALALQTKLRGDGLPIRVVLFTWPSDGSNMYDAYKSDRNDASASGVAFARAFLKLRDFLLDIPKEEHCGRQVHLLCHSMGNFLLESAMRRLAEMTGGRFPRVFGEVILAAADVDDDAFEHDHLFRRLPEIGRRVSVYFNRNDVALRVSDSTKGNPDRLGNRGPKHPLDVPGGVVLVDCSEVAAGLVGHSYYLDSPVRQDIVRVLSGDVEDRIEGRHYVASANSYRIDK